MQVIFWFIALIILGLTPQEPISPRKGKDYALIFAVDSYEDSNWRPLKNPISDAEAIAEELREVYDFEVHSFANPNKQTILSTLLEWQKISFEEDAQLFVFVSGHGIFSESFSSGYFVPNDGKMEDPFFESLIQLNILGNAVSSIPCPHILLAIDACYSGTIDEEIAFKGTEPVFRRPNETDRSRSLRMIEKQLSKQSRFILTSGGKERTPDGEDHSPFAKGILTALRESNSLGNGLLSFTLLLSYMEKVSPLPHHGTLPGHEGGGFIFIGRKNTQKASFSQNFTKENLYETDLILKEHNHEVQCVDFSRNGSFLASSGKDNLLRIWDANLGTLLHKLDKQATGYGQCIDFAPNSKRLAAATWDGLSIWDWEEDAQSWRLRDSLESGSSLNVCSFSGDGKWLASDTESEDYDQIGQIMLRNADNLQKIDQEYAYSTDYHPSLYSIVTALEFSYDSKFLASGYETSDKGGVIVWRINEKGHLIYESEYLVDGSVSDLAFHPEGNLLGVSFHGEVEQVAIIDLRLKERVKTLSFGFQINSLEFHPDGKILALGGYNDVILMETQNYTPKQILPGHAFFVTFGHGGEKLAAATGGGSFGCDSRGGSCAVKVWRTPMERN